MTEPADHRPATARGNPMLWLVIGLPALAVVASITSYVLAATHGDRELPASYHWEGGGLDADDARLAAAAHQGLSAELRVDGAAHRCIVVLRGAAPAALRLDLTHPTSDRADRHVLLTGNATSNGAAGDAGVSYGADCAALAAAHWWVQLGDDQGSWMLRARASGTLDAPLTLTAPAPAAAGATAAGAATATSARAGSAGAATP